MKNFTASAVLTACLTFFQSSYGLTEQICNEVFSKKIYGIALGLSRIKRSNWDVITFRKKMNLMQFTSYLRSERHWNVVFDQEFSNAGFNVNLTPYYGEFHAELSDLIHRLINENPNEFLIYFNLEGINLDGLGDRNHQGFTLGEINLIFSDQKIFKHTKWFISEKELTIKEVINIFEKYFPDFSFK